MLPFDTVLIANRGEIAIRVMRACKELGLKSVAIYAEPDRSCRHVSYADLSYSLGEGTILDTYLNAEKIIQIAKQAGAGAIHPGYGFLAENAHFARACAQTGIVFIGPSPDVIEGMGSKIGSRERMIAADVPVVPGSGQVTTVEEIIAFGERHGWPIAIKASGGGGGKGLRPVFKPEDAERALQAAQREGKAYFGDETVYLEKYLEKPRHIEVQLLGDKHGNVIHLGERDCSMQRRHQKVVEESPAPNLSPDLRARILDAAVRGAKAIGYSNAGTFEFLVEGDNFYFLEANTRLQVEHPVTEMVTGIDLVKAQLRVAGGHPLPWKQEDIQFRGHAIECRITCEDAAKQFMPAPGLISDYREPAGPGVRVDSTAYAGWEVPRLYDSMIAKLIVHGEDRDEAIGRMSRALSEYVVDGVPTIIPFHSWAMKQPEFRAGLHDTNFIGQHFGPGCVEPFQKKTLEASPAGENGKQAKAWREVDVEVNGRPFRVRVAEETAVATLPRPVRQAPAPTQPPPRRGTSNDGKEVTAPMAGTVVKLEVQAGAEVKEGQKLLVLEAMKMENDIVAHATGRVKAVHVAVGASVASGALLVEID